MDEAREVVYNQLYHRWRSIIWPPDSEWEAFWREFSQALPLPSRRWILLVEANNTSKDSPLVKYFADCVLLEMYLNFIPQPHLYHLFGSLQVLSIKIYCWDQHWDAFFEALSKIQLPDLHPNSGPRNQRLLSHQKPTKRV